MDSRIDFDELHRGLDSVKGQNFDSQGAFNKISEQVARNHGETDSQRRVAEARVYSQTPGPTYGAKNVQLANARRPKFETTQGNIVYVNFKKTKDRKLLKMVIAGCLAGVVLATGVNAVLANMQNQSFEEANTIEQTVDLPNDVYGNYDLEVQNNGDAYFVDENGNRVSEYNGMTAEEAADTYAGLENQSGGRSL